MSHKLSQMDERKLMAAIEKIGELVEAGSSPNDAVVKAASDLGVRPGHVSLIVNAYNTGKTAAVRSSGDSTFDKAAAFDMADLGAVLEQLYPDKVKTAAEERQETAMSIEYMLPPTWLQYSEKAAEVAAPLPPIVDRKTGVEFTGKPEPYPRDYSIKTADAFSTIEKSQRNLDEVRRVKSAAQDKASSLWGQLHEYFRQPGHVPFGTVVKAASHFGPDGDAVMRVLAKSAPELVKEAAVPGLVDAAAQPYPLIRQLISSVQDFQEKKAAFDEATTQHAATEAAQLDPFVLPVQGSVLGGSWTGKEAGALGDLGIGTVLGGLASRVSAAQPRDDYDPKAEEYVRELTSPLHEQDLKRISMQSLIARLMSSDPVIAGYEQQDVVDAYNDIVATSPRSADNPPVIQAMLRKRLEQGSLDMHDLEQLTEVEDNLKKRDEGIKLETNQPSLNQPYEMQQPKDKKPGGEAAGGLMSFADRLRPSIPFHGPQPQNSVSILGGEQRPKAPATARGMDNALNMLGASPAEEKEEPKETQVA